MITEEEKQIRLEAASHKCEICGDAATNWIERADCKGIVPKDADAKRYFCDRHEEWPRLMDWPGFV